MTIGFIGLGKMGSSMTQRLLKAGHEVVAYDNNQEARLEARMNGAQIAATRDELISKLDNKIIWLMIPADHVDEEIKELLKLLPAHSTIIDGGNSDFRLSQQRAELCGTKDVNFIDVGTSGGILGLENGYALMIGGDESSVNKLEPIFTALAPENGWGYFGPSGSGHYVKMVHNAIEYGLMESYAEGYRLLKEGPYPSIDLAKAGTIWQHGSIIQSLLNELSAKALQENPNLEGIDGFVNESGEARWALEVAKTQAIETPAISAAFDVRLNSQKGNVNFATKLLAAMRNKFGGHAINGPQK